MCIRNIQELPRVAASSLMGTNFSLLANPSNPAMSPNMAGEGSRHPSHRREEGGGA